MIFNCLPLQASPSETMSLPLFDPNFTYLLFPGDTSPSLEPTPGPVEPPLESVYDHCSQNDRTSPCSRLFTLLASLIILNLYPSRPSCYPQDSHLVSQFPNISGRKLEYPDSFVPDGFYFPDMPMQSSSNSTDPTNRSPPHVFTTAPHSYRPRDSDFVESWLEPCNKRIGRVCKCLWPHCSEKFVQGSNNAHMHVHKHWGTKPYECATW